MSRLRVDFQLIPFTASFTATIAFGISTHDIFADFLGAVGLIVVAGVCLCEIKLRKLRREVDEFETGGQL
jgi:ABC-type Na+ efflux pump permease subunit